MQDDVQTTASEPDNPFPDSNSTDVCATCPCVVPDWYHLPPTGDPFGSYNCSGLALRRYEPIVNLQETIDQVLGLGLVEKDCNSPFKSCSIKFKIWNFLYKFLETDSVGRQSEFHVSEYLNLSVLNGIDSDFHIVSGQLDREGNEIKNVYSKSGIGNRVRGPGGFDDFSPENFTPKLIYEALRFSSSEEMGQKLWAGYVYNVNKRDFSFFSEDSVPSNARIYGYFGGNTYDFSGISGYIEDTSGYISHLASKGIDVSSAAVGFLKLELTKPIIWTKCYGE